MRLNPQAWKGLSNDPEIRGYVEECLDGDRGKRLVIVETDDGWAVRVTIPTAGAVTEVSQDFMLTGDMDDDWMRMSDIFDDLEQIMIWNAGIGLSYELDLPDDATAEEIAQAMSDVLDEIAPTS